MSAYTLGQERTSHKISARAVLALIGGVIGLIPVGTAYTFGNFSPYIVSYIRNRTDDTSLRNVDSLWVGAVASVSQVFGVTFGGIIDRHIGARLTIAIGGLIFSGSTLVTYFFIKLSFIALTISYGFINSIGAKIVYGVSVQTGIKWLPHRSSLAAGLILSGYGAGTLVFNQVITAYINPDNLSPDLVTDKGEKYFTDPDLLDRVPYCFLLLGGTFLAMQVVGVVFVTLPPDKVEPIKTIAVDQNGHMITVKEENMFSVNEIVKVNTEPSSNVENADVRREEPGKRGETKEIERNDMDTRTLEDIGNMTKAENSGTRTEIPEMDDEITGIQNTTNIIETSEKSGKFIISGWVKDEQCINDTIKNGVSNGLGKVQTDRGDTTAEEVKVVPTGKAERLGVKDVILRTLKTRCLYVLFFTVLCFSWALRFIATLYKAYGQTFINDDIFLALTGTISSIFNSLGRPAWGLVMDRFGYRVTMRCISIGFAAVCATLFLTEHMHKYLFMAWICALFSMYSGVWAVSPSAFARLYGVENTAINYGFIFVSTAVASIATLVVGTTLKDIVGYHGMFFMSAGLGILPFFLTFMFNGVDADGKRV